MRKFFALMAVVLLVATAATAFAKDNSLEVTRAIMNGELVNDLPARAPDGFARTDTLDFGYFQVLGGNYYAVLGERWTWDHGASNTYEGWYAVDETANSVTAFRSITTTNWLGHGNEVAAPIINGTGSVWCGLMEDEADNLCWDSGLGYGNNWCQQLANPGGLFEWVGGDVNLSFTYFNNTELDYDYSKVLMAVAGTTVPLNGDGFTDVIGTPPTGPWATYNTTITAGMFGVSPPANFTIYFEFTSDGGWSDEDGAYATDYGPFGFDDLTVSGGVTGGPYTYNYDADLQGWTAATCPGIGSYFSIQPVSSYIILDPCQCLLEGNIAAFHDGNNEHPDGQQVTAWSPPADRTEYQSYNKIFAIWDQYADMPQNNGVFYRPGWSYYPYLCPATGQYLWSGRKGQNVWHYVGDQPVCYTTSSVGTDWGVPGDCQLVGFIYEMTSDCAGFGIPSTVCTGQTNFTPIIDNVRIRMTGVVNAPVVQFDTGDKFIDGFNQGDVLSSTGVGNANIGRPLNAYPNPNNDPWELGDSLVIVGPTVTPSTRWDAKLWFRVRREGPGQIHIPGYRSWKTRVADGRQIVGPQGAFTWGWMDSVEVTATQVYTNKYYSYFKENDDDYMAGGGPKPEINDQNEIIQDGVLTPGTKIQYFVTGNYTCLPTTYYLYPDTTGGGFWEFEILPSMRTDYQTGYYKFPCVLYVDAYDRGVQFWMDGSFNIALNGVDLPDAGNVPDPTSWDRYDYNDAASNFSAPFIRNTGGENGATVAELLGYRFIVINTGLFDADGGTMDYRDWEGLEQWLSTSVCQGNVNLQGLWLNGDNIAGIVNRDRPSLLNDYLGAVWACGKYYEPDCPNPDPDNDQNYCTTLETVGTTCPPPAFEVDVWGNWCPQQYTYDVISTIDTGFGSKSYRKQGGGGRTDFAQVANDQAAGANKYRTMIDGYSINHMIKPDPQATPYPCSFDSLRVFEAAYDEITRVMRWTLNLGCTYDLTTLGLCQDPCLDPLSAPQPGAQAAVLVNRLEQNSPNPFNPSTTIRFSLAQNGPAKVSIYDVSGRLVKTLVDGPMTAGPHVTVWDGLDQAGHKVSAGIYWSKLTAAGFSSNMKMVVVR